jgi:glycine/D-amino acid oxidase-like deaminating enzyme
MRRALIAAGALCVGAAALAGWTGLRTQTADGLPVVGYDDVVPGFFWLAGQGGYGFQTSSGLAETAAAMLQGEEPKLPVAEALSPARPGL